MGTSSPRADSMERTFSMPVIFERSFDRLVMAFWSRSELVRIMWTLARPKSSLSLRLPMANSRSCGKESLTV